MIVWRPFCLLHDCTPWFLIKQHLKKVLGFQFEILTVRRIFLANNSFLYLTVSIFDSNPQNLLHGNLLARPLKKFSFPYLYLSLVRNTITCHWLLSSFQHKLGRGRWSKHLSLDEGRSFRCKYWFPLWDLCSNGFTLWHYTTVSNKFSE